MAPPQISRKTLGFLLLLAAAAVSPAAADDVVALTEADFEKEVGQDRGALVEFYAPWFATLSPLLVTAGSGPDESVASWELSQPVWILLLRVCFSWLSGRLRVFISHGSFLPYEIPRVCLVQHMGEPYITQRKCGI